MSSRTIVRAFAVVLVSAASAVALPAAGQARLSSDHRALFCGGIGLDEVSGDYAAAVLAEIKRREANGKAKDALRDMRTEYCGGSAK